MLSSWRLGYSYARCSGILSKSYIGARLKLLSQARNVHELYALVFPGATPSLPEPQLVVEAERNIQERLLASYHTVEKIYGPRIAILSQTMRSIEYDNAKIILRSIATGNPSLPSLRDAGIFSEINRAAYPDKQGLFGATRFASLARSSSEDEVWRLENSLDRQYYRELLDSAKELGPADALAARRLLVKEIRLINVCWALRLSLYYHLRPEAIEPLLIQAAGLDLCKDALSAANYGADDKAAWSQWALSHLVNSEHRGETWRLDPRTVESGARREIYAMIRRSYHCGPFSLLPAYAFLRLKQFEAEYLRSCFEALRMALGAREIEAFFGGRV